MNAKQKAASQRYHAGLKKYLKKRPGSDLEPARELGRQAMAIGLETLDMARIHEIALADLVVPGHPPATISDLVRRAGLYFAEAITPIEQTHRGAQESNAELNQIVKALDLRTVELADSVAVLKLEITRRQAVEESLRASEQTTSELLVKSRQMQNELRALSRQLLIAQEDERRKISRDLHDVIAQTLSGINVQMGSLKSEAATYSKGLQKKITDTQRLLEKSVAIVHRFAYELRPTVLDDLGLIPALKSLMKKFLTDTGTRVSLKIYNEIEESSITIRTALYRVVQEALTNAARHAQASQVKVNLRCVSGSIHMEIDDDGQGFEVEDALGAIRGRRLGLLGMRERIEMVGGTFSVESLPGKSTTIRVEIPPETPPPETPASKPLRANAKRKRP